MRQAGAARNDGRCARGHRNLDLHRTLPDRYDLRAEPAKDGHAGLVNAAADGNARHTRGPGELCDAQSGLAEGCLGVDPALAGDDEIRANHFSRRPFSS